MHRVLLTSITFLLLAAPALAAPGGSPTTAVAESPEATVVEIAAARDEADRLIAEAEAEGIFENITGDGRPTVLHRSSGLVCQFERGNPENVVYVFPSPFPRGDDVGCNMPTGGYALTHYATRHTEPITAEAAAQIAVAAVRERLGEVREFSGDAVDYSSEGLPRTYRALMEVSAEGRDLFTSASTAEVSGWIFKQRLTTPLDDALNGQLVGVAAWLSLLVFAQTRPFDAD